MPRIAIVSGRCFAGNAVLAGCSDLIIATESTALGMGGPAMIEGGGLGTFEPDAIGPLSVQAPNGVVDVAVADEAEAVAAAKRLLSYFQGPLGDWDEPDPARLRDVVPERRRRAYDVRAAIEAWPTPAPCSLRAAFAPRWSPPWRGSRAGRSGSSRTTRCGSRGRSPAPAPTRPRASSSSATPSGYRSSR